MGFWYKFDINKCSEGECCINEWNITWCVPNMSGIYGHDSNENDNAWL